MKTTNPTATHTPERPYVKAVMALFRSNWTPGSREWTNARTEHLAANGLDEMGDPLNTAGAIMDELAKAVSDRAELTKVNSELLAALEDVIYSLDYREFRANEDLRMAGHNAMPASKTLSNARAAIAKAKGQS